ncbi:hypothetical protein [Pseudooceanicola sp. MF1-13]|uniref:hypothetical protein n=1 Tax=Pseudooceanicola sp. MF1-13 TaxID=3379095 RepID=UPI0038922B7F
MTRYVLLLPFLLAACADGLRLSKPKAEAPVVSQPAPDDAIRPPDRPGDGVQTASVADTSVAPSASGPAASGDLGVTVASLGNAAEPGLWLKTPLVKVEGPGTVTYQGQSAQANLIPISGPASSGSRASLQLMQALGAPLTGLPEFRVSR